jgi:hypothetical protein
MFKPKKEGENYQKYRPEYLLPFLQRAERVDTAALCLQPRILEAPHKVYRPLKVDNPDVMGRSELLKVNTSSGQQKPTNRSQATGENHDSGYPKKTYH